ncbi:MAG: hypothetical protein EOR88_32045 [Mesorhizobium sp.]|nr:hypothetical protein EOA49_07700 [Mesorhizobium sp. M1A.F.Ca.IN.020.04.1.1]RUW15756.1 hypothetical protein EOA53_03190 [Mesorhizobium sp. M1A.F.Ca.IN.020.03.1.1]RWF67386.1 MAG: hypothetical protein EOQ34_27495 [Mesorhizobium sp.]RWG18579.1 MAG: hypothetical protein EOQ58_00900 [Mesorhizobium sp.]RWG34392.1 MAG: hypothetical protein EOQ61_05435 [Mesorhizobium sp.]
MTTAAPLARYGAIAGALASGFATAELHHLAGHDRNEAGCRLAGSDLSVATGSSIGNSRSSA